MQLKTYSNNTKLGSMLPKEITKLNTGCQDLELKEKIESLLELMNEKLTSTIIDGNLEEQIETKKYQDWENEDYLVFRKQLSVMFISTFVRVYDIMMEYLKLPKQELEKELRNIDKLLELHTFDDRRVVKQNDEIDKDNQTFEFIPHVFTVSDLPLFLQSLDSKIFSLSNTIFKEYEKRANPNLGTNDKITELKLLIEALRENDKDLIKLIQNECSNFMNKLPKNHILHLYLQNTYEIVLINNKKYLETKLAVLSSNAEKDSGRYFNHQKDIYFGNKAKEKVKKEGYRFG